MIDWQREAIPVRQILENLPVDFGVGAAAEVVSQHLGRNVTSDALRKAMVAHCGASPGGLLGRSKAPPTDPSDLAPLEPPKIGSRHLWPLVEPTKQGPPRMHLTLTTGDWHAPYHCDEAIELFFKVVDEVKPDAVVLMGDCLDAYCLSTFSQSPERKHLFKDEVGITAGLLDRLSGVPEVHYLEGNHEFRLPRYLEKNARALWGMVDLPKELGIGKRGWHWHPYRKEALRIGKMAYKHDVGPCGKYAMQQSLAVYGGNITFGHTHRGGTVYQATVKGSHRVALNTGWMGDVEAVDYRHIEMARAEYQLGFGMVYMDPATGNVFPQFKAIVGGTVEIEGQPVSLG